MEGLEKYEKVYEDTRKILGDPIYVVGALVGRTERTTDEKLKELNEYAKNFLEEDNRGMLRTILIVLKPYKNHDIIKDTAAVLADKLRAGSKNDFI